MPVNALHNHNKLKLGLFSFDADGAAFVAGGEVGGCLYRRNPEPEPRGAGVDTRGPGGLRKVLLQVGT